MSIPSVCTPNKPIGNKKILKYLKANRHISDEGYKKAMKLLKMYPDEFYIDSYTHLFRELKNGAAWETELNYGVKIKEILND